MLFLSRLSRTASFPSKINGRGSTSCCPVLIKPLETRDWWEKMLDLTQRIAGSVPCYFLEFDKNGGVIDLLREV